MLQFEKYQQRVNYLKKLISKGSTGSSQYLAKKLGISRRMFYEYLNTLKEQENVVIKYCRKIKSYYYDAS